MKATDKIQDPPPSSVVALTSLSDGGNKYFSCHATFGYGVLSRQQKAWDRCYMPFITLPVGKKPTKSVLYY